VSSTLGIAIMMNNYFHDVATALLLASGVVMLIIVKKMERSADESVKRYFLNIYTGVTRLAKFSLLWILIGGIPRTLAYKEFEWANAAGKGQITALIIKHILAFTFVGGGAFLWLKLHKRVREIRESVK
jgi:heme/copper-type cytochrome/quinol oxidase subunit 3